MDLIEALMNEKGGDLIAQIAGQLGIDSSAARQFVPAAAEKLMAAVQGGDLDLGGLLGGSGLSELVSKVDVGALASQVGMQADQAQEGLTALAPALLSSLKDQAGSADGLLSMLGGGDEEGLLGGAAKLAGKLLG